MSYLVAQSINCTSDSEASVGSSTKLGPEIGYFKEKMAENESANKLKISPINFKPK